MTALPDGLLAFSRPLSRLPDWVDAFVVAALCVAIAACVFGVTPSNLAVPLLSTGDGGAAQFIIKTVLEHGWYTQNPDVGAPFGTTMYDFPIPEPTHLLLIRTLGIFGRDPFLVFNLFYLSSFVSCALAAWWGLRFIGADRASAFAGAFLFTLLPFHFLRLGHVHLASYFAVPIFAAHATRLALYRAPHLPSELRFTAASVVLLALAAGSGVYYAFFGCAFIAAGAVLGALASRRATPLRIGGIYVLVIVAVVAASLVPNALYHVREGANALVAHRTAQEAEHYGLRIVQLLLPSNMHRFGWMSMFTLSYNAHTPLVNENATASLGLLGSFGFLAALGIALTSLRTRFPRVAAMGTLSIAGVLFATIGGFGSLFALIVTPELRGLNRISVFIGFFAIASLLFLVRRAVASRPLALAAAAAALMLGGAIDEIPVRAIPPHSTEFADEQAFFDRIEAMLPSGTAVYELPYMFFPESPDSGSLLSYDLFAPYLHTQGLRWSFGGMHGRPADLWNEQVSTLHAAELVGALANAGFGAVYIDRRGYADNGAAVERELSPRLGPPLVESADRAEGRVPHRLRSRRALAIRRRRPRPRLVAVDQRWQARARWICRAGDDRSRHRQSGHRGADGGRLRTRRNRGAPHRDSLRRRNGRRGRCHAGHTAQGRASLRRAVRRFAPTAQQRRHEVPIAISVAGLELRSGAVERRESFASGEGRGELVAQILDIFDADGQPDQPVADAEPLAIRRRHRRVRHDRRMLDQAFDAAERFGEREQLAALEHAARLAQAALDHDRDDAARTVHLPLRERVLRMRLQARIDHALDGRMLLQPLRERERVRRSARACAGAASSGRASRGTNRTDQRRRRRSSAGTPSARRAPCRRRRPPCRRPCRSGR